MALNKQAALVACSVVWSVLVKIVVGIGALTLGCAIIFTLIVLAKTLPIAATVGVAIGILFLALWVEVYIDKVKQIKEAEQIEQAMKEQSKWRM